MAQKQIPWLVALETCYENKNCPSRQQKWLTDLDDYHTGYRVDGDLQDGKLHWDESLDGTN